MYEFGVLTLLTGIRYAGLPKVLIFNHESFRESEPMLQTIYAGLHTGCESLFRLAIFCASQTGVEDEKPGKDEAI